jgi:Secretion system C-terminal sorting domain
MKTIYFYKCPSWQKSTNLILILFVLLSGNIFAQTGSLIMPSVTKSRLSGVAPLAIHFDATATTAASLTARPFHDLEYRWNFGDEVTSTWAHGAQSGVLRKNEAFGPVSAHVYETAGTYNPTLQVRYRRADGSFEVENFDCGAVTVTAADTEWAGAKTICVSSSGTFTDAPAGSVHVTSSSANAAIAANIGSGNVRILFRAGESFTASASIRIAQSGPSMIGSFGVGAKPNIVATLSGNAPIFNISSEATPTGVSDWRFQDLSCNGGTTGAIIFFGDGHSSRMLMHRVETNNTQGALTLSGSQLTIYNNSVPFRHAIWDEFYIVNSTLGTLFQTNGNVVFGNCTRMAAIGNTVNTGGFGEHGIRMQLAQKSVFSNNTIQGIASGRNHLTLRGVNFNGSNTVPPGTYSELNVVSDNRFTGGANAQTLTMNSQFAAANERGRNCIVERNWFEVSATTVTSIRMAFTDVTIRNNVANILHNSGGNFVGAQDASVAGEHYPDRVNVYNNSVYHASTASHFYSLFSATPDGSNLNGAVFDVRNNILYAPTAPNVRLTFNSTGATINTSNNSTSFTTSPLFTANPPTTLAHFTPSNGSYANDGGMALPVCSDFYRTNTPVIPDMGAVVINNTILPIVLLNFNLTQLNGHRKLNWRTATETNNNKFQVERSDATTQWHRIGTVKGVGNTTSTHNYTFTDSSSMSKTVYYRIKQIDHSGSFSYSKILTATVSTDDIKKNEFKIYPNPSTGIFSIISFEKIKTIQIFNFTGQSIVNQSINADNVIYDMDLSAFPKGVYFIKINALERRKVVIQ